MNDQVLAKKDNEKIDTSAVDIKGAVDVLTDPTAIKRVKINIRIDSARMKTHVSANELMEIETAKVTAQIAVMAKFIYEDGAYIDDQEKGIEMIGKMSLGQLDETMSKFLESMQSATGTGPK